MSTAYRFRLASLLRLRQAELDQAEAALARANDVLSSLITKRNEMISHCKQLDVAPALQNGVEFNAQRDDLARVASAVGELDAKVNVAAAEAALAHIQWSTAHERVAMLERLDDNRRGQWRAEQARREANDLDELATAAFVRDRLGEKVGR